MSTDNCACQCCCEHDERVRYFSRQLLTADDMSTEQRYFRQKLRHHNRYMHGFGVVCGLEVTPAAITSPNGQPVPNANPWRVKISSGYALGPQGDEIMVCEPICFDLNGPWLQPHDPCVRPWPCPPTGSMPSLGREQPVYLAVRYAECDSRPVRVHPIGCGCDESSCEYSRVRDDFELAVLWELPDCYKKAKEADTAWQNKLIQWRQSDGQLPFPTPDCPICCDTPWIILASIRLPQSTDTAVTTGDISYRDRRIVLSTSALQTITLGSI